jgi:hypothetical protein
MKTIIFTASILATLSLAQAQETRKEQHDGSLRVDRTLRMAARREGVEAPRSEIAKDAFRHGADPSYFPFVARASLS